MKKTGSFILFFFLLFFASASWSEQKAEIFFINLFSENADVKLVSQDNDVVFLSSNNESYNGSKLLNTEFSGETNIYFKLSSSSEWLIWIDEKKNYYTCSIKPGRTHAIVIGTDGRPAFYILEEEISNGTRICFLNAANTVLPKMEVGTAWHKNTAAYTDNLAHNTITVFVPIEPGDYSLFWQFKEQLNIDNYYCFPDDNGDPEIFEFEPGHSYLFIAYSIGRSDYAVLRDLTN